ncbi:hypothetical protein [Photobacterium carnosum]|uniref:hypothetical protein n=1 Tax=Photobacterium carnosum TaxID=2023717 RepID=UPI001E4E30DF|nr:hypothetical protein [Photobacterium carnosum]MCD9537238.1 hypothetical protein [Photobacterium carnosum]MCF2161783.1 hypothetical protein [Photobacterium carnosum]
MNNINFWLESFDKLRVERNPFKAHIIANSLNEHEQNQYAVLQAAFVLANGAINQDQERLYGFWLAAINNNLSLSNIITQAQVVDLDALRDGINLLEEKGLIEYLLVDVLVFSRLVGGLTDNLKTILGEWCQLLSLSEAQLNDIIALTDHILGVEEPKVVKLTDVMGRLLANKIWQEFYVKPLTKEMLNNSINGGIWSVEDTISTECDIKLTNTVVIFKNTATIKQINSKLILTNVRLINPVFDLYNVAINFEQVVAVGGFDKEQKITSFTLNSTPDFSIRNSKFELINARCFKFKDEASNGLFESTVFENCGNEYLNGGVASYKKGVKFNSCEFTECIANIGGAVYAYNMLTDTFISCDINNCTSIEKINDQFDYAIYARVSGHKFILNSNFSSSIVVYNILDCDGDSRYPNFRLLWNSKLEGNIFYKTCTRTSYLCTLDPLSVELSGADNRSSKNYQSNDIADWSND